MKTFFVNRGYPTDLIDLAHSKASNASRHDLLHPNSLPDPDNKIPLILTYHPFNLKVKDIVNRNFHILRNDPETSPIFTEQPLTSYRRSKNIKDSLVQSALKRPSTGPAGTFSCGRSRCYTCACINPTTHISGPKSDHTIRHKFSCTSTNVIYCITCDKCPKIYIGETGRRLSDRFAEHLRSARNNDADKPVARHFNSLNHYPTDMKVCALLPISGGNDNRKRQEKRLIYRLGTTFPDGLNERFSFI